MTGRGGPPLFDPTTSPELLQILQRCSFDDRRHLHCAVSGGADSLALLALAVATGASVTAHHVDHGLRPDSRAEADVVAEAAVGIGAAFVSHRVHLEPGPNTEERARVERYRTLPVDVVTGHTADDQAETMLLALLRGSAWAGMSAMAPGPNRPLLALRRSETEAVCRLAGLAPVEDPSNTDPAHRRNRVRHELLPLLHDIADRDLVPVLVRQAELFREGGAVLEALAAEIDPVDARALVAAPQALARLAVRTWLWTVRGDDHPPDLATVDRVLGVARLDSSAADVGGGWRVERSRQRLRLVSPDPGSDRRHGGDG